MRDCEGPLRLRGTCQFRFYREKHYNVPTRTSHRARYALDMCCVRTARNCIGHPATINSYLNVRVINVPVFTLSSVGTADILKYSINHRESFCATRAHAYCNTPHYGVHCKIEYECL